MTSKPATWKNQPVIGHSTVIHRFLRLILPLIMLLKNLFRAANKFMKINAESFCNFQAVKDGYVFFASFNHADIRPVQTGMFGKIFLWIPFSMSLDANIEPKNTQKTFIVLHNIKGWLRLYFTQRALLINTCTAWLLPIPPIAELPLPIMLISTIRQAFQKSLCTLLPIRTRPNHAREVHRLFIAGFGAPQGSTITPE